MCFWLSFLCTISPYTYNNIHIHFAHCSLPRCLYSIFNACYRPPACSMGLFGAMVEACLVLFLIFRVCVCSQLLLLTCDRSLCSLQYVVHSPSSFFSLHVVSMFNFVTLVFLFFFCFYIPLVDATTLVVLALLL